VDEARAVRWLAVHIRAEIVSRVGARQEDEHFNGFDIDLAADQTRLATGSAMP
jgi:hypothetical protein